MPVRKNYPQLMTVWPHPIRDRITNEMTYGQPTVFKCQSRLGGSSPIRDQSNTEFVPKQMFWTELDVVSGDPFVPDFEMYIADGDQSMFSNPSEAPTANPIKMITGYNNGVRQQVRSYKIAC